MQTKKTTIDIHTKKKKQPKHHTKNGHQITKENKKERNEKYLQKQSPCILVITLILNGLNAPTKRHRLDEWIQKQDPYICCLRETHFRPQDIYGLKLRG